MSPRTGRPKSENPKSFEIKARIDEATNERLLAYCNKYNKTRTEVIREGLERVLSDEK